MGANIGTSVTNTIVGTLRDGGTSFFDDEQLQRDHSTFERWQGELTCFTVCILPRLFFLGPTHPVDLFLLGRDFLLLDMANYGQVLGLRSDFVKL